MCTEHGEVKIIDFGMSEKTSETKKVVAGTPLYLAPEVLTSKYGVECDIWSLGVSLYSFLTGEPPFDAKNCDGLYQKIKKGEYTLPFTLSKGARDLISKMLVVNPSERISASEALNHPWVAKTHKITLDR